MDSAVVSEIVDLGRSIGLEVSEDDAVELVEGHEDTELSTQDLVELQKQEEELMDSSEDGEGVKKISELTSSQLKELLNAHEVCQKYLQYLPDEPKLIDFLDSAATIFVPALKNELKQRQKQRPMERFLKRQKTDEEPSCSAVVELSSSSSSST